MTICYMRYMGEGGCISYCYRNPIFFHRDPSSWAIHEYSENKKNGLMLIEMFVDLLEVFNA